jgi:hypothetical protein
MRALIFILSAAAILLFTTCEEDGPTTVGPNEADPSIASISKTGENNTQILKYSYNNLFYMQCLSDSEVFYVTGGKMIIQSIHNPTENFEVSIDNTEGVRAYNEGELIIFSNWNMGDIFKIQNRENELINITNTPDTIETFPIYLEDQNAIVYTTYQPSSDYLASLVMLNLSTGVKTLLYSRNSVTLIPLYTAFDGDRLIFFETRENEYDNGYFKSLLLTDPNQIELLGSADITGAINSSISDDNKIMHTSNGQSILFNINTLSEKTIGGIYPNHSYISKDGQSIVSAQDVGLCLYDEEGFSSELLLENIEGERYFHRVCFSPTSNTIVYIQSKSPEYY